jgi:hypothetical protein
MFNPPNRPPHKRRPLKPPGPQAREASLASPVPDISDFIVSGGQFRSLERMDSLGKRQVSGWIDGWKALPGNKSE